MMCRGLRGLGGRSRLKTVLLGLLQSPLYAIGAFIGVFVITAGMLINRYQREFPGDGTGDITATVYGFEAASAIGTLTFAILFIRIYTRKRKHHDRA